MRTLEHVLLLCLVGAVAFLLGRGERVLHADGTADSNGRFVAVTGPYQQGVSLLYVLDTETKQLAVYEARGGGRSSGRVQFVAARRIDLDLRLDGYHDDSEFSYADLAASFKKSGWSDVGGTIKGATPAKNAGSPDAAPPKGDK